MVSRIPASSTPASPASASASRGAACRAPTRRASSSSPTSSPSRPFSHRATRSPSCPASLTRRRCRASLPLRAIRPAAGRDPPLRRRRTMPTSKSTAEATMGEVAELPRVDDAIAGVERLYQTLTGGPPPPAEDAYAPIPVEQDAAEFVTERLARPIDAPRPQPAPRGAEPEWTPPMTVWGKRGGLVIYL